jgi:predicted NAD/FAD-dependent oxidoreductase
MTNRKTLVVGAGITGGALARLLHDAKRSLQYAGEVLVWEKSSIAGGRMMARSFRKNRNVHVDMGAQYLTKFTSANDDVREMLLQHEKLSVFEDREILQDPTRALPKEAQHHTVAHHALGFRSVVEYMLTGNEQLYYML